jgi:hypothetical protein
MIKAVHGSDSIFVTDSNYHLPYVDSTKPSAGMLRYKDYNIEVYDGNGWLSVIAATPHLDLSPEIKAVLAWAKKAMHEEKELERLAKQHPAVNAALENVQRAQQQLKTTIILSQDEQTTS